jgi:hypothetical protein
MLVAFATQSIPATVSAGMTVVGFSATYGGYECFYGYGYCLTSIAFDIQPSGGGSALSQIQQIQLWIGGILVQTMGPISSGAVTFSGAPLGCAGVELKYVLANNASGTFETTFITAAGYATPSGIPWTLQGGNPYQTITVAGATSTPSNSPTPSPTNTPTPTNSATPILTSTPSGTLTPSTATPVPTTAYTVTATSAATSTLTNSATPTATFTPTSTFTPTASLTPNVTSMDTFTSTPTWTPTSVFTPAVTATNSSTPTLTPVSPKPFLVPNPVRGSGPVTIQFSLASPASHVTVEVFSLGSRLVDKKTWFNLPAGNNDLSLFLTDKEGMLLANGLYFVVIQTPQGRFILKLLILH